MRRRGSDPALPADASLDLGAAVGSERGRRIRDALEAALSDIILLGTDEQVRLAANAAHELVAGRPVPTHELVISLRDFVREALDLQPNSQNLVLPAQGPTRPSGAGARGKGGRDKGSGGGGGAGAGGGGGVAGGGSSIEGIAGDPSDVPLPKDQTAAS